MPRSATALSPAREDEETTTHVDELIQRGRGQGYLSLPELRDAFDQARVSPTEARSIIRELTEAGVQLANEPTDTAGAVAGAPDARGETDLPADAELEEVAAALAAMPVSSAASSAPETDLDDQTSVMG